MPKLRHYDHLNTARFVTFSCYHRFQLLTDSSVIMAVIDTLQTIRTRYQIKIFGYVVMPEHVHLARFGEGTGAVAMVQLQLVC
jgi:putative transposase